MWWWRTDRDGDRDGDGDSDDGNGNGDDADDDADGDDDNVDEVMKTTCHEAGRWWRELSWQQLWLILTMVMAKASH